MRLPGRILLGKATEMLLKTQLLAHAPLIQGLQAGLPPLDFSPIDGANKDAYIAGIHAALGRNYVPLTAMFERVISQTWTQHAASSAR